MDCKGVAKPLSVYAMISSVSGIFLPLTGLGNLALILTIIIDPLKELRTRFNFIYVNTLAADACFGFLIDGYRVWGNYLRSTGINLKKEYPYTKSFGEMCHVVYFGSLLIGLITIASLLAERVFAMVFNSRGPAYVVISVLSIAIWALGLGLACLYYTVGYSDTEFTVLSLNMFLSTVALLAASFLYGYAQREAKQSTSQDSSTVAKAPDGNKDHHDFEAGVQRASGGKGGETEVDDAGGAEAPPPGILAMAVTIRHKGDVEGAMANAKSDLFAAELLVVATAAVFMFALPACVIVFINEYDKFPSCIARHWIGSWKLLSVATHKALNPYICLLLIGPYRRGVMHLLHIKRANRVAPKTAQR